MTTQRRALLLVAVLLELGVTAHGAVSVSDLFADHMVLQRGVPLRLWGHADATENVMVTLNGQTATTSADTDGNWKVELPAQKSGGPYTLEITGKNKLELTDVLIGDVWVASGQSNMGMLLYPTPPWTHGVTDYQAEIAAANHPTLRFFKTFNEAAESPKAEIHGVWQTCTPEHAANFSAVAYYFGQSLNTKLNQPIGIIVSAVGSTSIVSWLDQERAMHLPSGPKGLAHAAEKRQAAGAKMNQYRQSELPAYYARSRTDLATSGKLTPHPEPYKGYLFQPSGCYNAMIAPLTRLPITGFIWYQGEGDNTWAAGYTQAFEALIQSWRAAWQESEAPFLFVQISAYDAYASNKKLDPSKPLPAAIADNWPKQRLAQSAALELPRTGMAVSCDFGDHITPHYPDKKPVGERLARLALHLLYGQAIEYHGPIAGKITAQDHALVVPFETGGGQLQGKGAAGLAGFELAGADKIFHPAPPHSTPPPAPSPSPAPTCRRPPSSAMAGPNIRPCRSTTAPACPRRPSSVPSATTAPKPTPSTPRRPPPRPEPSLIFLVPVKAELGRKYLAEQWVNAFNHLAHDCIKIYARPPLRDPSCEGVRNPVLEPRKGLMAWQSGVKLQSTRPGDPRWSRAVGQMGNARQYETGWDVGLVGGACAWQRLRDGSCATPVRIPGKSTGHGRAAAALEMDSGHDRTRPSANGLSGLGSQQPCATEGKHRRCLGFRQGS